MALKNIVYNIVHRVQHSIIECSHRNFMETLRDRFQMKSTCSNRNTEMSGSIVTSHQHSSATKNRQRGCLEAACLNGNDVVTLDTCSHAAISDHFR
jgi:hypothetical protein